LLHKDKLGLDFNTTDFDNLFKKTK